MKWICKTENKNTKSIFIDDLFKKGNGNKFGIYL